MQPFPPKFDKMQNQFMILKKDKNNSQQIE